MRFDYGPTGYSAEAEIHPAILVIAQSIRLAREAMQNAVKHAAATEINVHLAYTAEHVALTIADDGCGFALPEAAGPDTGHFGLSSMKERVQRLGGSIEIQGSPNHGTTIRARIPISPP